MEWKRHQQIQQTQQISASIGQQEAMNQRLAAQQAARIQQMEAMGEDRAQQMRMAGEEKALEKLKTHDIKLPGITDRTKLVN